jgi:hypothetical protein
MMMILGKVKIEKQIKVLLENPSVDCVHFSSAVVDEMESQQEILLSSTKQSS